MRTVHRELESKGKYLKRVYRAGLTSLVLIVISLSVGVLGYRFFDHLSWIDSLVNASMILGGMGPVDSLKTDAAKIFASFYAIYSGVAFLTIVAILFAPVYHRYMHKFHLYITQQEEDKQK